MAPICLGRAGYMLWRYLGQDTPIRIGPFIYKKHTNSAYEWGISLISSSYKERHTDRLNVKDIVPLICIDTNIYDSLGYVRMNTCSVYIFNTFTHLGARKWRSSTSVTTCLYVLPAADSSYIHIGLWTPEDYERKWREMSPERDFFYLPPHFLSTTHINNNNNLLHHRALPHKDH